MGKVCQVDNSITFGGKPIGSEDFLNQMVETSGIAVVNEIEFKLFKKGVCREFF